MGNILKKYNLPKAQWEVVGGAITGDTLPIGAIMPYTSKTTPSNWLPCNGQAVSRTDYADLFAIIGTQYGAGDGSTTFNVPDLNDYKVPIGYDRFEEQSNRMNLGTTGGEETHKLTVDEMPSHNHAIYITKQGLNGSGSIQYDGIGYGHNMNQGSGYTQNTGGNQAHNNMQPYVTTNYIIKAFQSAGVVAQVSNTKSDSTTDTYSCDYVNELEEWTQLTASGATSITLPENYKEIRVIVINNAYQNWYIGTFTKDFLITAGDKYYRIGHYTTSSDNSSCTIRIKSDLVVLADAYINGSDRTSTSTVYVYYR